MEFRFKAIRKTTGEEISSQIVADDEAAARRGLRDRGFTVLEIHPVSDAASASDEPARVNPDGLLMVLSFLMPLAGFIVGAIFLTRDHLANRSTGRSCLFASMASIVVGLLIVFFLFVVAPGMGPPR